MASYLDLSDASVLTLVARRDRLALSELFRRYGVVVLIAAGWTHDRSDSAEGRTVAVFLDVWERPEAFVPGADSLRSHLIRAALLGADEEAVRLAAARLAELEGWTYHQVAEVLARPARDVAMVIRTQLSAMHRDKLE